MDGIEVQGGHPLQGQIAIHGSKNAILPVIAGAILHRGVSVLHNCPNILDVMYMVEILRELGCRICREDDTLIIDATVIKNVTVSEEYAARLRSSIILMGSLLGRMKQAQMSYPGGCTIGARPIALHLEAFRKMNATIDENDEIIYSSTNGLKGTAITLPFPSVGATENIILGAVLAEGRTILTGAAKEPEIEELCIFLNQKGARIEGLGTGRICIDGVKELHDSEYTMCADRIVAGTYILAAMGTRGGIIMPKSLSGQLNSLLETASKMGAEVSMDQDYLRVEAAHAVKNLDFVETMPYPGFPTDLQSQLVAVLCMSEGKSIIRENMFEDRFQTVTQLQKMGARVSVHKNDAIIEGVKALKGCEVMAEELRGGAALTIAGLMAEGVTRVYNKHFVDRGYANICEDLRALGAVIYPIEKSL